METFEHQIGQNLWLFNLQFWNVFCFCLQAQSFLEGEVRKNKVCHFRKKLKVQVDTNSGFSELTLVSCTSRALGFWKAYLQLSCIAWKQTQNTPGFTLEKGVIVMPRLSNMMTWSDMTCCDWNPSHDGDEKGWMKDYHVCQPEYNRTQQIQN